MRLIGHDREAEAIAWAKMQIGLDHEVGYAQAFSAVDEKNNFALVVVFSNFGPGNLDLHIAGVESRIQPKGFLRMFNQIFDYAFRRLRARRVTGLVGSKNDRACRFAKMAGFTHEGTMRSALPDDDVCIFGFLSSDFLNHKWYEAPHV